MVGVGLRDFECSLCGNTFEQMSGDLVIPGPEICEDCLRVVWDIDENALVQFVTTRLREQQHEEMVQKMLQHIHWYKDTNENVDEVINRSLNPFGF